MPAVIMAEQVIHGDIQRFGQAGGQILDTHYSSFVSNPYLSLSGDWQLGIEERNLTVG
jgi:hypothetical protein